MAKRTARDGSGIGRMSRIFAGVLGDSDLGGELGWFELADSEGTWHAATARIDEASVVVTSVAVTRPQAVRYG